MNRDRRLKRLRKSSKQPSRIAVVARLGVLIGVLVLLVVATLLLVTTLSLRGDRTAVQLNLSPNASLNPAESLWLSMYLAANRDALDAPMTSDSSPVDVEVASGETATDVASNLASLGLIRDATLFRNYLKYYGLDTQLEAGSHELARNMTIPQVAVALTKAKPPDITIRIPEGWRREQMADWIDQQSGLPFRGADLLAATGAGVPLPDGLKFAGDIPSGATLEGFLFPDTYKLKTDATARDLVSKALSNFDQQVTDRMHADIAAKSLNLYQVIILASIVEREAAVAEERPLIASVYLNRLAANMNLQADPTVQYAMGFQQASGQWWNLDLTPDDYQTVDSPYNTYLYQGLPPGPIANPSLASIEAVIYPAQTQYLYFRARCDGSGRHIFAVTYEEHLKNACP